MIEFDAATPDLSSALAFDCPRCGSAVDERFYGPCASCRTKLRATMANEQSDLDVVEYEPKMNVTPNAVAVKD